MEALSSAVAGYLVKKASKNKSIRKVVVILSVFVALGIVAIPVGLVYVFTVFLSSTSGNLGNQDYVMSEVAPGFPAYAQQYLPIYQEAGKKYGVPWEILAGIHKIETDFGRNLSVSSVGARGHFQFMDKTWLGWSYPGGTALGDLPDSVDTTDPKLIKIYGGYGVDGNGDGKADPNDPVDAIHAAAKYLAANHRPGEDWFAPRGAVWHYNHDYEHYVLKVKSYAEQFAKPVENKALAGTGQFLFPVEGGEITSTFGRRFHPLKKVYLMHEGIDVGKGMGAPILAADSGVVVESRQSTGYGWKVVIDHGKGIQTVYAHMYQRDVKVHVGQSVQKGQVIALIGANGWSTGPHLHFEVHRNGVPVDPMAFFKR